MMNQNQEEKFWNNKITVREFFEYPKDQYWQEMLKKYKADKFQKVLDLGCGGGRNTEILIEAGFDTYACDYSSQMIKTTRERLKQTFKKSFLKKVVKANMTSLPYEDGTFNLIIANGVFHNAYTPKEFDKALSEVSRVLKEEGVLLLNLFTTDTLDKVSVFTTKTKNLFITKDKLRMTLYSSDVILKKLKNLDLTPVENIQRYTRNLSTGARSVLKTVLTKKKRDNKFPQKGIPKREIEKSISSALKEILSWKDKSQRFGFAMTEPGSIALETYKEFIGKNNNNTGMHTLSDQNTIVGTRKLEVQVINWLGDLFNLHNADGYITSGGTEGNTFGLWIGRNYLKNKGSKKVCVISTDLSHISVVKAANILGIDNYSVEIDEEYSIDIQKLFQKIDSLYALGYDSFILYLTAGYYSTGTVDKIEQIDERLKKLKLNFYIHVDAAFGGFVFPFSNPDLKFDFRLSSVNSITIDPHKMGLMPYSCGIFLCRKDLVKYIETSNQQAHVIDRTLIGSRPGATAAAFWALLSSLGYKGYRNVVVKCLKNKQYFIEKINKHFPESVLISDDYSNNFAVSLSKNQKIDSKVEKQFRLVSNALPVFNDGNVQSRDFYHFYIMPHITKTNIDYLFECITRNSHE